MKRQFPFIFIILSLVLAAVLAACAPQVPPLAPTIDANEVATIVAATLAAELSPTLAPSPTPEPTEAPPLLPHSVYFLSNASGSRQLWCLGRDGVTLTQITNETVDVESFDVSPADGALAFVAGNQLWLADATGGSRQLLVDGRAADINAADFYYTERISGPQFSPEGGWLAYAHNGLRLLDLNTGDLQHLLVNQIEELNSGSLLPEELYFPEAWSPDGRRLLVSVGYLEGGTLAVYDFEAAELIRFQASGILCCQSAWTQDSAAVLVASPYLGLVEPGLWHYAAADGAETVLVEGSSADGTFHYFGWPTELPDGQLTFFYSSSAGIPEGDVPLFIMRSAADGATGRQQLRQESFNIREALWALDGSLALIIENPPVPTGGVTGGAILLVNIDGSPTQALASDASEMQWGP